MLVLVVLGMTVNAQKVITESKTFRIVPGAADTIGNGITKHNYIYIPSFAQKFKVQCNLDSIKGNPHVTVIIRKSMDNITWNNLDTLLMVHTTAKVLITDLVEPYTPYLDIQALGTTGTQTTKLTYTVLIQTP